MTTDSPVRITDRSNPDYWTIEQISLRVSERHPSFNAERVASEARFIRAGYEDSMAAPLDAADTEARRLESAEAHANDANAYRAFINSPYRK